MDKKEYYRLCLSYKRLGFVITISLTISEPFEEFLQRQLKNKYITNIEILLIVECSKLNYEFYKRYNPIKNSDLKLKEDDYNIIDIEEDEADKEISHN